MIRRMQASRVVLRGQALADSKARHAANRKPAKSRLAAEQAIVARWNAGTVHAPDRMTVER